VPEKENLNLSALVKTRRRGHSKSSTDAAVGGFLRMLKYKSLWNGGQVVKVGCWFPSPKTCHRCPHIQCPHIQHLELSDRRWACISCGAIHDRDHNAAINTRAEDERVAHGCRTALTISPRCMASKLSCQSPRGLTRFRMGARSIWSLASMAITFSHIGQLWL